MVLFRRENSCGLQRVEAPPVQTAPPRRWVTCRSPLSAYLIYHIIMLSYYLIIILSHDHIIIFWFYDSMISYYHIIILSYYHIIILSYYHINHFMILSCYHIIILSFYLIIIIRRGSRRKRRRARLVARQTRTSRSPHGINIWRLCEMTLTPLARERCGALRDAVRCHVKQSGIMWCDVWCDVTWYDVI